MTAYAPSPREQEVLALLMEGHTTAEIAGALSIAAPTVGHHVQSLMHVHGARTRLELVCTLWARRVAAKDVELEQERLEHRRCQRDLAHLERRGRAE